MVEELIEGTHPCDALMLRQAAVATCPEAIEVAGDVAVGSGSRPRTEALPDAVAPAPGLVEVERPDEDHGLSVAGTGMKVAAQFWSRFRRRGLGTVRLASVDGPIADGVPFWCGAHHTKYSSVAMQRLPRCQCWPSLIAPAAYPWRKGRLAQTLAGVRRTENPLRRAL